jgi:hypothetical protein
MANYGCYRISGTPNIHEYFCNGNATTDFYEGDLVLIDTDGRLNIAATGTASTTAGILGIAKKRASADSTTATPVDVIVSDGSEFVMYYAGTTSETLKGTSAVITFTAGSQKVSTTAGTDDCYILDLDPRDGAKAGGRVIIRFVTTHLQSECDV